MAGRVSSPAHRLSPTPATLYGFSRSADGAQPYPGAVVDAGGKLSGTTESGAPFVLTLSGRMAIL